jgi:GNAT superfamily N-acetyltransferase
MNFQELYNLIHESPDNAEFWIPTQGLKDHIEVDYEAEEAYTFIIFKGQLFYAYTSDYYHGEMMHNIAAYFLGDTYLPSDIYKIGKISDKDLENFQLKEQRIWNRSSLLSAYPDVIQGRSWYGDRGGLISVWNDIKYITPEYVQLIKQFIKKIYDKDQVYLEAGHENSILIDTLLHNIKPEIKNNFDTSVVHLAPPEKKREMLLKMGAKPKIPLDLKQRQAIMGESSKRSIPIDWDTLNYEFSETVNNEYKLTFFNKNGAVGYIEWDMDDGEVSKIYVGDIYRRQGVGTYIWDVAQEYAKDNRLIQPEHSSKRTQEGDAFAQSIGGYIPSLRDDVDGWSSR